MDEKVYFRLSYETMTGDTEDAVEETTKGGQTND